MATRLPLLLLVAFSACSTAHGRAVDRAHQARASGDHVMEAWAWREACRANPSDYQACVAGEEAARAAVTQQLADASDLCRSGTPRSCLDALRASTTLLPNDPRLLAVVDQQIERHTSSCGDAPTIEDALDRLVCLEGLPLDSRAYGDRLAEERRQLARRMDQLGASAGKPGAALAWAAAAACIQSNGRIEALNRAVQRVAVPVGIQSRVEGASLDLCPWVRHPGVICGPAQAQHTVEITGRLGRPVHRVQEEIHTTSYQAGVRRLPNPAHAVAATHAALAERAVHSTERDLVLLRSSCKDAENAWHAASHCLACPPKWEKDRVCNAAHDADDLRRKREWERIDAVRELSLVPEFVDEPVLRNHRYPERIHRWEAAWNVSIDGMRLQGRLLHEDLERPGFAAAGLEADPLERPGPETFNRALAAQLAPAIEAKLSDWLAGRARERDTGCDDPMRWENGWLGCWAESTLWSGAVPDGGELVAPAGVRCQ